MLKEKELENIRRQYEIETDPEKKTELARQMDSNRREIEPLKKQSQLTFEQEKRSDEIFDKELKLTELQRITNLETNPEKKVELYNQLANKQKELEILKRHNQLADDQKMKVEVIAKYERDLANQNDQLVNEKDPIKRAELERIVVEREKETTGLKIEQNIKKFEKNYIKYKKYNLYFELNGEYVERKKFKNSSNILLPILLKNKDMKKIDEIKLTENEFDNLRKK
jgi:hypothetical protein